MKKIFAICLLMVLSVTNAQTFRIVNGAGNFKSTVNHAVTDTITNATTMYQYAIIDGYNDIVVVQPTFTKISGTAAATVKLQGSVNGTSYNDIGSSYTVTNTATQSTSWIVTPSSYKYYRLEIVPTGTQSVKVVTPVIVRNKPVR
ncbi:hypothetical protein [Flavobacterium sedimenticola]|uniref:Uncharacterized protein n=1 Tax=Flavobacterium sedimenticola TaxID=3043286 RepID=A0ABT6XMN7_9FLAO|nr:hypothetical protein [Flavobacterium sedimenticola]MDI9256340.1 hypothetical protein [Flavobacterium sedimenticola]